MSDEGSDCVQIDDGVLYDRQSRMVTVWPLFWRRLWGDGIPPESFREQVNEAIALAIQEVRPDVFMAFKAILFLVPKDNADDECVVATSSAPFIHLGETSGFPYRNMGDLTN